MVREEQLLKRIQELETENEKLRTQLNRRTSGAVDGAAEQTRAKYADRILDTLPDMMTVWTNSGVITELISSEETNHVGVPSERFIGMNIRELLPEEAYRNVRANLDHVLETKRGSTGRHDLTVDGAMTDPKGDRSKAPHDQADPDMFVHVVDEPSEIRKYMKKGVYGFYTDYWSPRALEELRESGE